MRPNSAEADVKMNEYQKKLTRCCCQSNHEIPFSLGPCLSHNLRSRSQSSSRPCARWAHVRFTILRLTQIHTMFLKIVQFEAAVLGTRGCMHRVKRLALDFHFAFDLFSDRRTPLPLLRGQTTTAVLELNAIGPCGREQN